MFTRVFLKFYVFTFSEYFSCSDLMWLWSVWDLALERLPCWYSRSCALCSTDTV